jgi:hypothetical protein
MVKHHNVVDVAVPVELGVDGNQLDWLVNAAAAVVLDAALQGVNNAAQFRPIGVLRRGVYDYVKNAATWFKHFCFVLIESSSRELCACIILYRFSDPEREKAATLQPRHNHILQRTLLGTVLHQFVRRT